MNNLISRQDAIDAVHEEFDEVLVWDESGKRTADEFEDIIARVPSAQPERKRGRRIIHGEQPMYVKECSACGEKFFHHQGQGLTPYCSMCGAEMTEGEG